MKFVALGGKKTIYEGLETFPTPPGVERVVCRSDEVTALCPITGQPDWYEVEITYLPLARCVESKSLKLFLQSFRNSGHFCEDFSHIIAKEVMRILAAKEVTVKIRQKPRGGISIEATTHLDSYL